MSKEPIDDDILIRYLTKETSAKENILVEEWISLSQENNIYFLELTKFWKASNSQKDFNAIDVEKDWKKVEERINALKPQKRVKKLIPSTLWKVAAGFALLLALSIYTYTNTQTVTIATTDTSEKFVLPDGSLVWLNTNSEISYKKEFSGTSRDIELQGEGYFEVQKDPQKPFIIELNNTETKVLGTQFNLKENIDKSVSLVLVEGSVQFSTKQEQLIVSPGESIEANLAGNLNKAKNLDANFISWKTNILKFDETPFSKVIQDIEKLYNVSFSIENEELLNCNLTMEFDQESIDTILETLQILYGIDYELKNKSTYLIKGGKC